MADATNTESILDSVKEDVGVDPSDTNFDTQLVRAINTSLLILYEVGYGDKEYRIKDRNDTWAAMATAVGLSEDSTNDIKTYVSNRVKQYFDPAGVSSSVNNALNEQNAELTWYLNSKYDRETEDYDE